MNINVNKISYFPVDLDTFSNEDLNYFLNDSRTTLCHFVQCSHFYNAYIIRASRGPDLDVVLV